MGSGGGKGGGVRWHTGQRAPRGLGEGGGGQGAAWDNAGGGRDKEGAISALSALSRKKNVPKKKASFSSSVPMLNKRCANFPQGFFNNSKQRGNPRAKPSGSSETDSSVGPVPSAIHM